MSSWRQRFALSTYDNRWQEYFCASRCIESHKSYLAVRVCSVCCGRRTRKVENDDLNRRASAMSVELVRRRSSIDYDNLPVNRV